MTIGVVFFPKLPYRLQFYSEPLQQQDGEHRSASEPAHEVRRLHQELLPDCVLGAGGAGAALFSLLARGIL